VIFDFSHCSGCKLVIAATGQLTKRTVERHFIGGIMKDRWVEAPLLISPSCVIHPAMLLLLFIEPRPARSVHPISSKRFAMLLNAVLISIAIRTGMVGAVVA
jgi:hypothetical protein